MLSAERVAAITGVRVNQCSKARFGTTQSVMTAITAVLPHTPIALLLPGGEHCAEPSRLPPPPDCAATLIAICLLEGPYSFNLSPT